MFNFKTVAKNISCAVFVALLLGNVGCSKETVTVDAKKLMEARCSVCHFSTNIYAVVKDAENWERTISRMDEKNPELMTLEEVELITNYLKKEVSTKQIVGQ